jgi:hypothetical protein
MTPPTEIHLANLPLSGCNRKTTPVKIVVPTRLYEPVRGRPGKIHFYRDAFLSPGLALVVDGREIPIDRYTPSDHLGWAFLCIHAGIADSWGNVHSFLRRIQIFIHNQPRKRRWNR